MTDELLKAIHAKTNAIDAVNDALKAEWQLIEDIDKIVQDALKWEETKTPDLTALAEKVAELKALNSALPAAVVANVAPATAGPVGKSPAEQTIEAAEPIVTESLARVADAAAGAARISEGLQAMFNDLQQAALSLGAVKAVRQ